MIVVCLLCSGCLGVLSFYTSVLLLHCPIYAEFIGAMRRRNRGLQMFFFPLLQKTHTRSAQVHALVLQTRRASALACSCRYLLVAAGITAVSPTDLTRCTCALRAWVARVPSKPATCDGLGFFSFFSSTKSSLPLQERKKRKAHGNICALEVACVPVDARHACPFF